MDVRYKSGQWLQAEGRGGVERGETRKPHGSDGGGEVQEKVEDEVGDERK
jgi:hypothetical protein